MLAHKFAKKRRSQEGYQLEDANQKPNLRYRQSLLDGFGGEEGHNAGESDRGAQLCQCLYSQFQPFGTA